jgi:hypothetical protein
MGIFARAFGWVRDFFATPVQTMPSRDPGFLRAPKVDPSPDLDRRYGTHIVDDFRPVLVIGHKPNLDELMAVRGYLNNHVDEAHKVGTIIAAAHAPHLHLSEQSHGDFDQVYTVGEPKVSILQAMTAVVRDSVEKLTVNPSVADEPKRTHNRMAARKPTDYERRRARERAGRRANVQRLRMRKRGRKHRETRNKKNYLLSLVRTGSKSPMSLGDIFARNLAKAA